MNPKRHDEAVNALRPALAAIDGVRSVILFGSTARGTAAEESDVDLFIECEERKERQVERVLGELDRRFGVRFSAFFYRREDWRRFDLQFLESIFRQGRVLLGTLPPLTPIDLDLQPLRLVSYQTKGMTPRKRAKLLREIDGYRTVKRVNEKRYVVEKAGLLKDTGGWRVGRGAVVIPEEKLETFDKLLRRYGAKRHIIPIWCQRP